MSQNNAPPVFAVHLHQKQRNAAACDELYGAETWSHAALLAVLEAEAYGVLPLEHGCLDEDDFFRLRELDAGPCVLKVLRSREWPVTETAPTDEPECDGTVGFELIDPCAEDVDRRRVVLVRYVYEFYS